MYEFRTRRQSARHKLQDLAVPARRTSKFSAPIAAQAIDLAQGPPGSK